MAKAARVAIVEVEELVETGTINPDDVHLPGIFVDRIVVGTKFERRIEVISISWILYLALQEIRVLASLSYLSILW